MSEQAIKNIATAYIDHRTALASRCTCTGFVLQYEGCLCGRKDSINETEGQLFRALDQLLTELAKEAA